MSTFVPLLSIPRVIHRVIPSNKYHIIWSASRKVHSEYLPTPNTPKYPGTKLDGHKNLHEVFACKYTPLNTSWGKNYPQKYCNILNKTCEAIHAKTFALCAQMAHFYQIQSGTVSIKCWVFSSRVIHFISVNTVGLYSVRCLIVHADLPKDYLQLVFFANPFQYSFINYQLMVVNIFYFTCILTQFFSSISETFTPIQCSRMGIEAI